MLEGKESFRTVVSLPLPKNTIENVMGLMGIVLVLMEAIMVCTGL